MLAESILPVLPALSVVEGNEVEGSLVKGSLLMTTVLSSPQSQLEMV